jgi:hypothetical protein
LDERVVDPAGAMLCALECCQNGSDRAAATKHTAKKVLSLVMFVISAGRNLKGNLKSTNYFTQRRKEIGFNFAPLRLCAFARVKLSRLKARC